MAYYVTTSNKAGVFHDQALGITVYPKTVTELTNTQFNSRKVQSAIAGGHLVIVSSQKENEKNLKDSEIKKLDKKIKAQFKKGNSLEKISEQIDLEKAKELAAINEIEVDEGDEVIDILKAILVTDQ